MGVNLGLHPLRGRILDLLPRRRTYQHGLLLPGLLLDLHTLDHDGRLDGDWRRIGSAGGNGADRAGEQQHGQSYGFHGREFTAMAPGEDYSCRNASTGGIRIARCTGVQLAATASSRRRAETKLRVARSVGLTLKRSD